jgi:hypothetical protein
MFGRAREMRHAAGYLGRVVLGLVLLGMQGCGMSSAKPMAEAAVTTFHNQLNAEKFDIIWDTADDSFRQAGSRDNYNKLVGAVHRKLGMVLKTTNSGWRVGNFL